MLCYIYYKIYSGEITRYRVSQPCTLNHEYRAGTRPNPDTILKPDPVYREYYDGSRNRPTGRQGRAAKRMFNLILYIFRRYSTSSVILSSRASTHPDQRPSSDVIAISRASEHRRAFQRNPSSTMNTTLATTQHNNLTRQADI